MTPEEIMAQKKAKIQARFKQSQERIDERKKQPNYRPLSNKVEDFPVTPEEDDIEEQKRKERLYEIKHRKIKPFKEDEDEEEEFEKKIEVLEKKVMFQVKKINELQQKILLQQQEESSSEEEDDFLKSWTFSNK